MLESLLPQTRDIEKRIIAYLLKNPERNTDIKNTWFLIHEYKVIHRAISSIVVEKKTFDLHILLEYIRKNLEYDFEKLSIIDKEYEKDKFASISGTIDLLKQSWVKSKVLKNSEGVIEQVSSKEKLDLTKLGTYAENISSYIKNVDENNLLLTGEDLALRYMEEQDKRSKGILKRSFGLKTIDDKLLYPGEPGCYSLLVGMTGSGKSIVKKQLENGLVHQGICVLTIDLEMPTIISLDRSVSMARDVSIESLLAKEKPQRLVTIIDEEMESLASRKNYLYVEEPSINLEKLDRLIVNAKEKFKEEDILPDDGYIFIFVDLITMIEEFSGVSGSELDKPVNLLNALCKKHNVHILGVAQANENKLRGRSKHFKNPEEIDKFQIQKEDIKGGSALAERARMVWSLLRPLEMKKHYFPQLLEELSTELDLMHLNLIKKNLEKNHVHIIFKMLDNFRLFEFKEKQENMIRE